MLVSTHLFEAILGLVEVDDPLPPIGPDLQY
jgi:hypothetical protein